MSSNFDVVMSGVKAARIDPRNPPPEGPTEMTEAKAQKQIIALLSDLTGDRKRVVTEIREISKEVAAEIEAALDDVVRRREQA